MTKILPLLTSPTSEGEPSFHVVTFSLPGYGFSEAPHKKGFSAKQYAEVGHKLMQFLGYKEYGESPETEILSAESVFNL